MTKTAFQISSYEISKNEWLVCEVVVRKIKDIKDGYIAYAKWRECAFYVPTGTSADMQWNESNTMQEWQERVNNLPTWPKMEDFRGGKWVCIKPTRTPSIGGKQRIRYVKK
jgi:hypothetical protein